MLTENQIRFDKNLTDLALKIDISPSKYQDAVERYTAVGKWLEEGHYSKAAGLPNIYPQGSFRLGTIIRPIAKGKESDYDIDLVCQLSILKKDVTPKDLKIMVGDRLKENANYKRMLDDEGRRCWTLKYAQENDGIGFHMDILPSVPTDDSALRILNASQVSSQYSQLAIDITDKASYIYNWKISGSNPEGYARWFDQRKTCHPNYDDLARTQKRAIFESSMTESGQTIFASVDQVPEPLVKTPLQRAIQILKRHRDIHFQDKSDNKPISIIITTLAAKAYENETELYPTLYNIVRKLTDYEITGLIKYANGRWYVPNPVNPDENFADRWNDKDSQKAQAFFDWLQALKKDFDDAIDYVGKTDLRDTFWPLFGVGVSPVGMTKIGAGASTSSPSRPRVHISNPNKPWRP